MPAAPHAREQHSSVARVGATVREAMQLILCTARLNDQLICSGLSARWRRVARCSTMALPYILDLAVVACFL